MTAGDIYTIAGNGTAGYSGDGGPATSAELYFPEDIAVDSSGDVVIVDASNNRIRVVAGTTGTFYGEAMTAGDIYTIAGNGTGAYSGDGGPASSAGLYDPGAVSLDSTGDLFIADTSSNRIREVTPGTGGTGGSCGSGGSGGTQNMLVPGAELSTGQSITTPGGTYSLTLQSDGNLVEYNASGTALWASGTSGNSGDHVTMQSDGNLVLYSSSNSALWASGTNGNPGASLVLTDAGNLVVDSVTGTPLWAPTGLLIPGAELTSGQSITTPGGAYRLTMQSDGNVVEYNSSGTVLWASGTGGSAGTHLSMQGDGNLVLYGSSSAALWASGTSGNPGAYLVLGDDGNLVVDSATGSAAVGAHGNLGSRGRAQDRTVDHHAGRGLQPDHAGRREPRRVQRLANSPMGLGHRREQR